MRNVVAAFAMLVAFAACDPTIKKFEVVPEQLDCPGAVKVSWQGDADGGRLQADQPVLPALPPTVLKQGSFVENVTTTTTFHFFYPSAAQRFKTVTVAKPSCAACAVQTLTFTGQCTTSQNGPSYVTLTVGSAVAPGLLKDLDSDANFPVHVLHAGQDIALNAGGGPLFPPLPAVPAAGDYTIVVPGAVGQGLCAGSGPTGGGTIDAPVIHLKVTPTCTQ